MTDRLAAAQELLGRTPVQLPEPAVRARLRNAVGWTQEEVAEALGVSRLAFQRWETGQARPHPRNRQAYLLLLHGWARSCPDAAPDSMRSTMPTP